MRFSFVWNFHNKVISRIYSNIFGTTKHDCMINIREIFIFLPVIKNSVIIGWLFLLLSISEIKYGQIRSVVCVFIWVVFIKIFISIVHIIWAFNRSFTIIDLKFHACWLKVDILLHRNLLCINKFSRYLVYGSLN